MAKPDGSEQKKIFVMSKGEFSRTMARNGITDENVENRDINIISINDVSIDAHTGEAGFQSYFQSDHKNVLRLAFADIETEKPVLVEFRTNARGVDPLQRIALEPFTQVQAQRVFEFLNRLKGLDAFVLIVHCTAGVSRSAAVAEFACRYLGADYEAFRRTHPFILPNTLVLKKLWGVAGFSNDYREGNHEEREAPGMAEQLLRPFD